MVLEGVGGMLARECTCPTEREMLLSLSRVGSSSARSALKWPDDPINGWTVLETQGGAPHP